MGQSPVFQWAHGFGGNANDYGYAVTTDMNGNVYIAGGFVNTVDFDPGPGVYNLTSNGSFDIFILKLNPAGGFVWVKALGNTRVDNAIKIVTVPDGSICFAGGFSETVDFDPGLGVFNLTPNNGNGGASYICKLDFNGSFIWAVKFDDIHLRSIDVDFDGNVLSSGGFYGIADFDPGPGVYNLTERGFTGTPTGIMDAYVVKLNAAGVFVSAFQIGSLLSEYAGAICVDQSGNFIVTGFFNQTSDFDPSSAIYDLTSDGTDIFIAKYSTNSNLIWAKKFTGGGGSDLSYGIKADRLGNISLTGIFASIMDFDPGPGIYNLSNSTSGTFIVQLDNNGNLNWAKQSTGVGLHRGHSIALDTLNNVYVTGLFEGTADFDPGAGIFNLTANGSQDIFIIKLSSSGEFSWAGKMGSSGYDVGFDIFVDRSRNIYTSGHFWNTVDFDPGPGVHNVTMVGTGDAFIQKLNQCANISSSTITTSACSNYSLNGYVYSQSGGYIQIVQNASGCDSVITLNLTINGSNDTLNATSCNSYVWNGQTYISSGFYRDTLTGAAGCDSIVNLDLRIKNGVSININIAICEGQSYSGYTTSGTYINTYTAANGCDSIRTLQLFVKPKSFSSFSAVICEGDTFLGYAIAGIYKDTLRATNGCDSIRTLTLTVHPRRFTSINAAICEGQFYTAGGANQTQTGIYRDTLRTLLGCDSVITTNLIVHTKPHLDLGVDRNLCFGESISFNPGLFASYQWHNLSTLPTFTANSVGVYWVSVIDNNNCFGTDTVKILTILPKLDNFLKPVDSICQYDELLIQPIRTYKEYTWSNGSRLPAIKIGYPGQYILVVRDANNCVGVDTIQIFQKNCATGVFIPTGFTPNGDQLNDILKVKVFGLISEFRLEVFNRWGELVFNANDAQTGWNGKYKGLDAPAGVYVWQCKYKVQGADATFKKGTLTLIR